MNKAVLELHVNVAGHYEVNIS